MDVLHISAVPNIVWIILASVTAGGVLNNFLSIRYFGPVLKLKKAMQQVAEGDFSVRLETEKQMKEIRDIYSNFNLMVQEMCIRDRLISMWGIMQILYLLMRDNKQNDKSSGDF